MKPICAICGDEITDETDTPEHIIPASIGGKRTVRKFIHETCNHKAGVVWDSKLSNQYQGLCVRFDIQKQGKKHHGQL